MKAQKFILPLFTLALLASCGGGEPASSSSSSYESTQTSSSQELPTFEAYTLSELHDARLAKTLKNLDQKYVAVKGKVTFAKHFGEDDGILVIQNGKHAVEVSYPDAFTVNVGDAVEVKGRFLEFAVGDTDTISISTYRSVVPNSEIKVIDEAINVETVTITKDSEVVEYDSSLSTIDFDVVGNRTNAAFIGKLSEGTAEFIVSNKLSVAEKIPMDTYAVGDKVTYSGVFSYSGNEEAKVIRYFDKDGFTKKQAEEATLTAVYFKDTDWWAQDGARSGIYLFNAEGATNASWPGEAMESLGNGVWKYPLDASTTYTTLMFTRIAPSGLADWGAKTVELKIADIDPKKPLYDISGTTTVWGDPGVAGNWVAHNA